MFSVCKRNSEIARIDELFRKYKVKAVEMVYSRKNIHFIEMETFKFSLYRISIFDL